MEKVDVAVQSFKKPEQLFYTLLSLYAVARNSISTVWINDDSDDDFSINFFKKESFNKAFPEWKIHIRKNSQLGGYKYRPIEGLYPKYLGKIRRLRLFLGLSKQKKMKRDNCRYQWAIDNTDKKYLLIIHDDVEFYQDVVQLMLSKISNMSKPGIVGELGQCWICYYKNFGCNAEKIMSDIKPSAFWPDIPPNIDGPRWPCRINEWCSLISVDAAKIIEKKHQILYGWFDNRGDTAAYWFSLLVQENFEYSNIFNEIDEQNHWFRHAVEGSGHSVWIHNRKYQGQYYLDKINKEFGISI